MKVLLRKQMTRLNLAPKYTLTIDNETHEYYVRHRGKRHKASYSASIDSFDANDRLICTLGILDSQLQYSISIIPQSNGAYTTKLRTNRK